MWRSSLFMAAALLVAQSAQAGKMGGGPDIEDPGSYYFTDYDEDHDGALTRAEWKNRGNFDRLDADRDGVISRLEFRVIYGAWGDVGSLADTAAPSTEIDASVDADRIDGKDIGKTALCAVIRTGVPGSFRCENGDALAVEHGLMETGIGPVFPDGAFCLGIDEIFGLDYTDKTGKGMHGGIDLPTGFGTPVLAVADGSVAGVFDPERNARGRTVVLRHSPADTGLPFWTFTEYAHLNALPDLAVGQRVKMGQVIGPTGNSGVTMKSKSNVARRRPGLHFAVYRSDSPRFAAAGSYIVPENPLWLDSTALYRKAPPYDSTALKALPDELKTVLVPVMYLDGSVQPAGTKLIWPYACRREG